MKSSEYLEAAAREIENANDPYRGVCGTLRCLNRAGTLDITDRIMVSLSPQGHVTMWLARRLDLDLENDIRPHAVQYRAAWCRWMAEGYRAKGD